ncbi:cathepsin W-like [Phyllobates terribilis]|uniref:cathepsin W-like n=1 Tax=Phyllobates terribilis TaxID=111132 RepID=UPI003CCA81CE
MYLLFPSLVSLCALVHVVSGDTELEQFENFIKQFKKVYESPEEYQYRLSVFTENLNAARRLQEEELGTATYGITKFSDLTDEEFTRNRLTLLDDVPPNDVPPYNMTQLKIEAAPVKRSCDWRKAGVISKAKDQGTCGSCWAFAAVGNIEAQWGILGRPVNLSVQQVLDCSPFEDGCKGGYLWDAYKTVRKQNGLVPECVYPYKGIKQACQKFNSLKTNIKGFRMLPRNENVMACYVRNSGTIAVGMNAIVLKCYQRGVIRRKSCDRKKLNHAVVLMGFSKGTKLPYWIIKNSWGADWGERGFFRLFFGKNMCGIATYPVSAIVPGSQKKRIRCPRL